MCIYCCIVSCEYISCEEATVRMHIIIYVLISREARMGLEHFDSVVGAATTLLSLRFRLIRRPTFAEDTLSIHCHYCRGRQARTRPRVPRTSLGRGGPRLKVNGAAK
jgi:hypothetical protein